MSKWRPTSLRLYDFPAIRHTVTKELALVGKRGEIWAFSDSVAAVLCRTYLSAKNMSKLAGFVHFSGLKKGDEQVFRIPNELVPDAIKIIKVPRSRPSQVRLAELV